MIDRVLLAVLIELTLVAVLLSLWAGALAPHFASEPGVSIGEMFSTNWWHPVLRLASLWLWLFIGVCWSTLGVLWFAAWVG